MFTVIFECGEVKNGTVRLCREGQKAYPVKGEWGPTSDLCCDDNDLDESVLTFKTQQDAERFAKKWVKKDWHPWYYKPNGRYEVVELKPIVQQICIGYRRA